MRMLDHGLLAACLFVWSVCQPDQACSEDTLEEIVVTANRMHSANSGGVPVSVSVHDDARLTDGMIDSITELSGLVPGLEVSANANIGQVTIRGIGSNTTLAGGETSSTIQVDGVYMARPSTALFEFLDVDRVEIHRGPQGTLYGRNATGGVINILTRKPGVENSLGISIESGSHNLLRTKLLSSGPVIEDLLSYSIAVQDTQMDGFIENRSQLGGDIGEKNRQQMRGKLRLTPSNLLSVTLAVDATRVDESTLYYAKPLAPLGLGETSYRDLHQTAVNTEPDYEHDDWGLTLTVDSVFEAGLELKSITGLRRSEMYLIADLDATDVAFLETNPLPEEQQQISQEFLLNIARDNWDLLLGVYYFKEEVDSWFRLSVFPAGIAQRQGREANTRAYAGFGELSYSFNPKIRLVTGVRYSKEKKRGTASGALYVLPDQQVFSFTNDQEDIEHDFLTPKVALSYLPTDSLLLYLSATRGFKAGGFNFIASPGEDSRFDPEEVWSYEFGLKYNSPSSLFSAGVSTFRMDYQDMQIIEFLGAGTERVRNADAAVKGLEAELRLLLTDNLTLLGAGALLRNEFSGSFQTLDPILGMPVDARGNRLTNAPESKFSVTVLYERSFGPGSLEVRGDVIYKDEVYFSPSNNNFERQKAMTLVHARVGYRFGGDRWTVALGGRNLTSEDYLEGAAFFIGPTGRPGPSRSWQISIDYRR